MRGFVTWGFCRRRVLSQVGYVGNSVIQLTLPGRIRWSAERDGNWA